MVFDMAALAPPISQSAEAEPKSNTAPPTATAASNQQDNQTTPNGEAGENVTSKGFCMSAYHQVAVEAMGLRVRRTPLALELQMLPPGFPVLLQILAVQTPFDL